MSIARYSRWNICGSKSKIAGIIHHQNVFQKCEWGFLVFTLSSFCFIQNSFIFKKATLDSTAKSMRFNNQEKSCTFSHDFLNGLPLKGTKNQTKLINIQITAVIKNVYMEYFLEDIVTLRNLERSFYILTASKEN